MATSSSAGSVKEVSYYVYAGEGQDLVFASQRVFGGFDLDFRTFATEEVVKCGLGLDLVEFDQGIDMVDRATYKFLRPIKPNGEPVNGGGFEGLRSKSDFFDLIKRPRAGLSNEMTVANEVSDESR